MVNRILNSGGFRAFFFSCFLLTCLLSHPEAASLTLSTDQAEVIPGDTFAVEFRFEGVSSTPNLDSLEINGFEVVNRSSSTSVRIVNGQRSDSVSITLSLLTQKEGVFQIGPYELKEGTEVIRSNSLEIRVTNKPSVKTSGKRIFAKASLNQPSAISGEQLFYHLKVYRPARNFGFSRLNFSLPEFQDLIVEEEQGTQKESQEIIDGILYQVTEIQVPIFAVRSGLIQIPPASISYRVRAGGTRRDLFSNFFGDDFFSRTRGKQKTSYSNSLELRVGSLPEKRPEQFSGLVGEFKFEAQVDRTALEVGENLTLTLRCTGIGSLQDWQGPEVALPGFKVYPDGEGVLDRKRTQEGYVGGIKTFKYALVPQNAGEIRLGPFQLIFYQPKSKTFRTASTDEFTITVSPSQNQSTVLVDGGQSSVLKKKVRVLSKDILPIELDWDKDRPLGGGVALWIGLILLVLLATLGLELRMRSHMIGLQNPKELAYRQSLILFHQEVEGEGGSVSEALRRFLLRKLKVSLREVTPQELCALMQRAGLEQEPIDRIRRLLEQEEMNRYTGISGNLPDDGTWKEIVREYDRLL